MSPTESLVGGVSKPGCAAPTEPIMVQRVAQSAERRTLQFPVRLLLLIAQCLALPAVRRLERGFSSRCGGVGVDSGGYVGQCQAFMKFIIHGLCNCHTQAPDPTAVLVLYMRNDQAIKSSQ